jgi:hypothetical protein
MLVEELLHGFQHCRLEAFHCLWDFRVPLAGHRKTPFAKRCFRSRDFSLVQGNVRMAAGSSQARSFVRTFWLTRREAGLFRETGLEHLTSRR